MTQMSDVRFLSAVLLLALVPSVLYGQSEGAISGRVSDKTTGASIAEVVLTVSDGRRGATTDTSGYFRIRQLRSGNYDLRARRIGYRPVVIVGVQVRAGQTVDIHVEMEPQAVSVEEITVEAPVDRVLDPLATRTEQRIEAKDLRELPVSSLNEALALSAGAVGESYRGGRVGETAFILDGLGLKNQIDASTNSIGLRIPPDILTEASLVTNGFSARYGQAISGVVNVVTKDGGDRWMGRAAYETDRMFGGRGDLGLDRFILQADGPLGGGVTAVVGVDLNARLDFDPVNAPAPGNPRDPFSDASGPLPNNSGEQYSFTAKLVAPITQRQTLRVFALKGIEQRLLYDPRYKYDPSLGPAQRVDGLLLSGHLQHTTSPTSKLPLVVDLRVGRFTRDFTRGTLVDSADYSIGAYTGQRFRFLGEDQARARDTAAVETSVPGMAAPELSDRTPWGVPAFFYGTGPRGEISWNHFTETRAQLDLTFGASQRGDFVLGGEFIRQNVETFQRVLGALPVGTGDSVPPAITSEFKPLAFAAYAETQFRLADLGFTLGLRFDHFDTRADLPGNPSKPQNKFNPRVSVATALAGATVVASLGSFSQPPDYQYLVDAAFDDTLRTGRFRRGNPQLGFENSWQGELSVRGRPAPGYSLRTNVYIKRLDGLIASVPLGVDPDSAIFDNDDYGTIKGFEVLAEREFRGGWGARLIYTLQSAQASSSSPFLLRRAFTIDTLTGDTIIPARIEFPFDYDRRHGITFIGQGAVPVGVGPEIFGVRPLGGLEGAVIARFQSGLPFSRVAPGTDSIVGPLNDSRLPWTNTVDMLLRRPITLGRARGSLYFDARNLFNRRNIVSVRRDTGTPDATEDMILQLAEDAYQAHPEPIPYESPRYRPHGDLDGNGVIEGRNELFPLYLDAARDATNPLLFYGPPRLLRIGVEFVF